MGQAASLPGLFVDPLVLERTVFNSDRTHRFTWFRHWGNPDDYVAGICMNPSGASEDKTDRTVEKMVKFSRELWGAGAYYQLNAMSIRGTYSDELAGVTQVSLPENDEWIRRITPRARFVVVGWGNPAEENGRGREVAKILREVCDPAKVFCFGINQNGSPKHPLYQGFKTPLTPFFRG